MRRPGGKWVIAAAVGALIVVSAMIAIAVVCTSVVYATSTLLKESSAREPPFQESLGLHGCSGSARKSAGRGAVC